MIVPARIQTLVVVLITTILRITLLCDWLDFPKSVSGKRELNKPNNSR